MADSRRKKQQEGLRKQNNKIIKKMNKEIAHEVHKAKKKAAKKNRGK